MVLVVKETPLVCSLVRPEKPYIQLWQMGMIMRQEGVYCCTYKRDCDNSFPRVARYAVASTRDKRRASEWTGDESGMRELRFANDSNQLSIPLDVWPKENHESSSHQLFCKTRERVKLSGGKSVDVTGEQGP